MADRYYTLIIIIVVCLVVLIGAVYRFYKRKPHADRMNTGANERHSGTGLTVSSTAQAGEDLRNSDIFTSIQNKAAAAPENIAASTTTNQESNYTTTNNYSPSGVNSVNSVTATTYGAAGYKARTIRTQNPPAASATNQESGMTMSTAVQAVFQPPTPTNSTANFQTNKTAASPSASEQSAVTGASAGVYKNEQTPTVTSSGAKVPVQVVNSSKETAAAQELYYARSYTAQGSAKTNALEQMEQALKETAININREKTFATDSLENFYQERETRRRLKANEKAETELSLMQERAVAQGQPLATTSTKTATSATPVANVQATPILKQATLETEQIANNALSRGSQVKNVNLQSGKSSYATSEGHGQSRKQTQQQVYQILQQVIQEGLNEQTISKFTPEQRQIIIELLTRDSAQSALAAQAQGASSQVPVSSASFNSPTVGATTAVRTTQQATAKETAGTISKQAPTVVNFSPSSEFAKQSKQEVNSDVVREQGRRDIPTAAAVVTVESHKESANALVKNDKVQVSNISTHAPTATIAQQKLTGNRGWCIGKQQDADLLAIAQQRNQVGTATFTEVNEDKPYVYVETDPVINNLMQLFSNPDDFFVFKVRHQRGAEFSFETLRNILLPNASRGESSRYGESQSNFKSDKMRLSYNNIWSMRGPNKNQDFILFYLFNEFGQWFGANNRPSYRQLYIVVPRAVLAYDELLSMLVTRLTILCNQLAAYLDLRGQYFSNNDLCSPPGTIRNKINAILNQGQFLKSR